MEITNESTGVYKIITSSGSMLVLNMTDRVAGRIVEVGPKLEGFQVNTIGFVNALWEDVNLVAPVKVGERIRLDCAPPQNWYLSTPVVSITPVD